MATSYNTAAAALAKIKNSTLGDIATVNGKWTGSKSKNNTDPDAVVAALGKAAVKSEFKDPNSWGLLTDRDQIQGAMDEATRAAYINQRNQAKQDMSRAENTLVADRNANVQALRQSLAGSAAAGGSQGAANASALQALLGLGQKNAEANTAALQNLQNLSSEERASMAENAALAIDKSNTALGQAGNLSNEKFASDLTYDSTATAALADFAQGIYDSRANMNIARETNASNERQTKATNKANVKVAKINGK